MHGVADLQKKNAWCCKKNTNQTEVGVWRRHILMLALESKPKLHPCMFETHILIKMRINVLIHVLRIISQMFDLRRNESYLYLLKIVCLHLLNIK